ncbi:competence protein ComK [Staphylococcus rostri]|nr:competence protein ComK [Staphylococcus rostri]MDO5375984.1 competence protein ComK [Staphylococcus rostri]
MNQPSKTPYVIDANVMLIKPISGPEGAYTRTELLYTTGKKKVQKMRPLRFIESACRHRYNSYLHIKSEVRSLTGISSKPPFFIPGPQSITFFSTHSDRVLESCWININYVDKIEGYKTGKSKIYLTGGYTVVVNVSQYTLLHQYQNGIHLAYTLLRREIDAGELVKKFDEVQHDELINVLRDFVNVFKEIRLALITEQRHYIPKIAEDPPHKNY